MKKALMAALLIATTATLAGCGFKGFKPVKDETANWRLKEEYDNFDWSERGVLLKYVQKMDRDFRECGIDPMFGLAEPGHNAAEGYICIENKGWYNAAGPTCTRWLLFDKPACVEWRKERGLEHMPKPERK